MVKKHTERNITISALAAGVVLATASNSRAGLCKEDFLENILSDREMDKLTAWNYAQEQPPEVIADLAEIMTGKNPSAAKAAFESLKLVVHSVGKEKGGERREQVTQQLIHLIDHPAREIQYTALRLLSLVADGRHVGTILEKVREQEGLWEEAVYCIERIPGPEATDALLHGLEAAPDSFKPRIMAALGHRRDEKAVNKLIPYMGSTNPELSINAMKALARIGKEVEDTDLPDFESCSAWNRIEYVDSFLRYADAQREQGKSDNAYGIYALLLDNPEEIPEHYQTAAVIGLRKIDSTEARRLIKKQLENRHFIVRDMAEKVLKQ